MARVTPDLTQERYDGAVPQRDSDPLVSRAFGRALKVARAQLDLTRRDVADRSGLPHVLVGRFERGEREPTLSAALAIARAIGMSDEEMLAAVRRQMANRPTQPALAPTLPPPDLKPLAGAVIIRDGRALLTQRRYHDFGEVWSWPSGKIEAGESLEEAILRELREELLIDEARILTRLGDIDLPSGYRMSHFHVAIPDDIEPRLNDYEQLERFRWMTRREAEQAFQTLDAEIIVEAMAILDKALARWASATPERTPAEEERGR